MSSTLSKSRAKYFCRLTTCTRPSKSTRLTLLAIGDWKAELGLLPIPYSRTLATSQSSTKLQLLQLQWTNRRTMPPYEANLVQSGNEGSSETASTHEDEAGVFVPNFVEEMVGGDHVLQMKMARAIHAQEQSTRRCFRCNSPDHLIKDCPEKMSLGPHSRRGLNKTSRLRTEERDLGPGQPRQNEENPVLEP